MHTVELLEQNNESIPLVVGSIVEGSYTSDRGMVIRISQNPPKYNVLLFDGFVSEENDFSSLEEMSSEWDLISDGTKLELTVNNRDLAKNAPVEPEPKKTPKTKPKKVSNRKNKTVEDEEDDF